MINGNGDIVEIIGNSTDIAYYITKIVTRKNDYDDNDNTDNGNTGNGRGNVDGYGNDIDTYDNIAFY